MQQGLLSTFVHSAVLVGFDEPYTLPQQPLNEESTLADDEDEDDEEGEEGDGEAAGPSGIGDTDNDVEELEDQCEELALASAEHMAVATMEKGAENSHSRKKKDPPGFVLFPEDFDNSQLPPLETSIEDE